MAKFIKLNTTKTNNKTQCFLFIPFIKLCNINTGWNAFFLMKSANIYNWTLTHIPVQSLLSVDENKLTDEVCRIIRLNPLFLLTSHTVVVQCGTTVHNTTYLEVPGETQTFSDDVIMLTQ